MKPILFNTDMVRAILEDCKTVTRRVAKLLANANIPCGAQFFVSPHSGMVYWDGIDRQLLVDEKPVIVPYRPGDILYVRETWRVWRAHRYDADAHIEFKAGGEGVILRFPHGCTDSVNRDEYDRFTQKWGVRGEWHPSIHMPREAARIFLRVTNVYPQQLKDVTEADASAEGFCSRAEFMSAILGMYPDCTENSWFWANEFERISREEAEHGETGIGQA